MKIFENRWQVSFDSDSQFFMFSFGANLFFMLKTFNATKVESKVRIYVARRKKWKGMVERELS